MLLLKPFTDSAWNWLILTFAIVNVIFIALSRRNIGKGHETSTSDIFYSTCMSIVGGSDTGKYNERQIRALAIAWYYFIFLVSQIYCSNLTAILSLPPNLELQFKNVDDLHNYGKSLCVRKGATTLMSIVYAKEKLSMFKSCIESACK